MNFARLFAAAALLVAGSAMDAEAETCGLGLMASLDMAVGENGVPRVPVSLNGATYQFYVDTAGVYSKLSGDLANKLGLKQTPTGMEIYSVKGMVRANSVDIESLKLGSAEARHFHLMVGSDLNMPSGSDGVLAGDLLALFDAEFDFQKGKLNLFSQDHCPGKVVYWTQSGYAELPFHFTAGPISSVDHIDFNTTLDGRTLSTDFDTGSTWTWISSKVASEIFGHDGASPGVVKTPTGGGDASIHGKQFGLLEMGGVAVRNPVIAIIEDRTEDAFRMAHSEKSRDDPIYGSRIENEQLTLGMNVITKLHIYIAYKEKKIYATAADAR